MSADNSNTWAVAEAKARLGELIEKAASGEPQTVTQKGRSTVVIIAAEEWERQSKRKRSLAEFFAASPLRRSSLSLRRVRGDVRKVEL